MACGEVVVLAAHGSHPACCEHMGPHMFISPIAQQLLVLIVSSDRWDWLGRQQGRMICRASLLISVLES